jgi:hypothetical protein
LNFFEAVEMDGSFPMSHSMEYLDSWLMS